MTASRSHNDDSAIAGGHHAAHRNSRNRQSHQSPERSAELRPVGVARLHPPRPAYQRRTEAPDRRRRPARHDFQSDHLRKSHHRQHTLRRSAEVAAPRAPISTPRDASSILAIRDIQDAADVLRPSTTASKRRDGYVSLEVSPYLARDTQGDSSTKRAACGRRSSART